MMEKQLLSLLILLMGIALHPMLEAGVALVVMGWVLVGLVVARLAEAEVEQPILAVGVALATKQPEKVAVVLVS